MRKKKRKKNKNPEKSMRFHITAKIQIKFSCENLNLLFDKFSNYNPIQSISRKRNFLNLKSNTIEKHF